MERGSTTQWIESPLWDGFWMFAGLWAPLLSLLVAASVRLLSDDAADLDILAYDVKSLALLYLPLSILHRISTTYSVLGTPILRDDIRKNPTRYLYVPLAIVAGCVLLSLGFVFHAAFSFLPSLHAQLWAFFLLAYVMILWERWHFCAQEFGVLSIYRIRAGQFAQDDRRFDRFYTVVLMLGVNMVLYVCLGFSDERKVLLYGTPLARYRGEVFDYLAWAAALVAIAAIAAAVVREWRHRQRSAPKTLFYILVGSHSLLLFAFPEALGLFFLSYAFHHWMVAVGLFGRVTARSYEGASSRVRALKLVVRVAPLLLVAVLFYEFFEPLDRAGNLKVPGGQAFAGASVGAKLIAGTVIGLFFALNFLHYYYDRCFYAFGNHAVREKVAPLLFGPPPASAVPGDAGAVLVHATPPERASSPTG